ncbi:hypothetical protein BJX66DRAFT_342933 [Aspergillus keveii]|uniref:Uncharacterized protein n=1 Tax=Aspergillus keveii TaxID=714993 RepID=A0ABR4FQV1_9EURO
MAEKPPETTSASPVTIPNRISRKSWITTTATVLFGLLWLGPIIALLVLNFDGYITGASIGCMGYCNETLDVSTINKFQSRSRNVLGAFQLVAKALEVWFTMIIGLLVYELTIILATSRDGLPLTYLTSNVSFADIRATLCSLTFWTSMKPPKFEGEASSRHSRVWLYCFVAVVALSCIVANLMGPAVAVLIIPTFGYVEISEDTGASVYFDSLLSADPPRTIAGCDETQIEAGRYSCTDPTNRIAPVDAMIEASSANGAPQLQTIAGVDYAYNTSRGLSWAYNHQVLWDLGSDRSTVDWTRSWPSYSQYTDYMRDAPFIAPLRPRTVSHHHYEHYRDSTRTRLGRRGPSIAVHSHCRKNLARIELAQDREVHCYSFPTRVGPFNLLGEDGEEFFLDPEELIWGFVPNRPSDKDATVITKCVRIGSGWGESSPLHGGFAFGPDEQEDDESRMNVDVYSTDRAIYLTPDNAHCAGGDSEASSCNWEDLFAAPIPPEVANTSSNVLITEYSTVDATPVVCETLAYLGFPTYQVEVTPTVEFNLVYLSDTERDLTAPPIRIHPDWILAGWSVDRAGSIPASRPASALMINAISATPELGLPEATYRGASAFQTHAINLGLSLIPFSTVPSPQDNAVQLDAEQEVTVWSYSLHSRTSILGVVIAIAGCVAVIIRTVVCLIWRSESLGLTQLLVATAKEPAAERLNDERSEKEYERQRVLLKVNERGEWPVFDFL